MTQKTPTERVEWLLNEQDFKEAHKALTMLLEQYETFLKTTNIPESELIKKFLDNEISREYMKRANAFGESVFAALTVIGKGSRLHRLLVV